MDGERVNASNQIEMFCHCAQCLEEIPSGTSPASWARLNVGWTPFELQVWCHRHNCNVINIDFEGQKHPANTLTQKQEDAFGNTHH